MKEIVSPKVHRELRCGSVTVLYVKDDSGGKLGLWLVPTKMRRQVAVRRNYLHGVEVDGQPAGAAGTGFPAWNVESLMQVKENSDAQASCFAQGRTMRNNGTVDELKFYRQQVKRTKTVVQVRTTFRHAGRGWLAHHDLNWRRGASWFDSSVTVENTSKLPVTLEMLASFALGGITLFARDDAPRCLQLHRFRSVWSMEGRLETQAFEDLQLEPSWVGFGVRCERFGAVGSLPISGYFPRVAVEDTEARVTWGAQLAHPGSWQMEVYRRDDLAAMSGGLADREFGHWSKIVLPGASFTSPPAVLACVQGGIDECCAALTAAQEVPLADLPKSEAKLPVIFNEWTSSWGDPSHDNMSKLAAALAGTGIDYLVMDAGWFKPDGGVWFSGQGDWIPNAAMYPHGIRATAGMIRKRGMLPGLWFEMEVVGSASPLFEQTDLLLHRDGRPITVGPRRFLDLRKPEVGDHLAAKVIGLLKAGNFGYLKVDYNDNLGIGVDGAESLGEGLRQHLEGVVRFFQRLRRELPELVIENCASGGHRLEPRMIGLTSMSSFSDAHECREIPIVAANLHRLMLPRQSQIWAVLRAQADRRRIVYVLAAGFLGRLCLSGNFATLQPAQRALATRAIALYKQAVPVIRRGCSYRHGPAVQSYRHAEGWQAMVRVGTTGKQAMIVTHTFAHPGGKTIRIPLPEGEWKITESLLAGGGVRLARDQLHWQHGGEWAAAVVLLNR